MKTSSLPFLIKFTFLKAILALFLICGTTLNAQNISPVLVGTNAWYTNPTDEVWGLTADCGVKIIRIGGNGFNDNLPAYDDLLDWVKKIQAMGAEPIMQVSQHQDAAAAADLVRFFNVEKSGEIPPVKYWNIGNEPWLEANQPATSTIGPLVEDYFKPRAEAMKEVDPTIKIYGPDFCYYMEDAIDDLFGGANDIAGKVPGKDYYYCDGLSWHRYPQDDNINLAYEGIADFATSIAKCKQKMDEVNNQHNRTGDDALIWGIGEYNAKGGPQVHTWENGQMFGGVLGLCMKYEAMYAASWSMFENGGNRQGTDFSFIDGANMTPRASYRHMEFVAKYFTGEYLDGVSSTDDFVVYGAKNTEHTAVMVMHRADDVAKEYTLHLNATATEGGDYVLNVDGASTTKYTDIISPRTTQVIIFNGTTITKINYSSEDFDNERAPVYYDFEMAATAPANPADLVANADSYKSITLSWVDNSDNEQGYIVEREGENGYEMIAALSANSTSFTNEGLSPETSYSYKVRAYNTAGKSDYTNVATISTLAAPEAKAFNGPHAIPGVIEIEDFNDNDEGIGYHDDDAENKGGEYRTTGVDIEACDEGGYNIGYVNEGEWLNYLIENVTAGTYDIIFRSASNTTSTKKVEVYFGETLIGEVVPTNTGGWQAWENLTIENIKIESTSPINMTLKFYGSGFNLNWVEFKAKTNTSSPTGQLEDKIKTLYNKDTQNLYVSPNHLKGSYIVEIVNSNGQFIHKSSYSNQEKAEINTSGWCNGFYMVVVKNQNERYSSKMLIY